MTDTRRLYCNYGQKQRSDVLQSHANDLIIYFRTGPEACHILLNKREGERDGERGKERRTGKGEREGK